MTTPRTGLPFLLPVMCTAGFVLITGIGMPAVVASHFDASGAANGFMPRQVYIAVMLGVVLLPALMVRVTSAALGKPGARINLPNRDHHLAPQRREQTVATLRAGLRWFGVLLLCFLGYAHWLVVLANRIQPPHLSGTWFGGGLMVFLVTTLVWLVLLMRRFRLPD